LSYITLLFVRSLAFVVFQHYIIAYPVAIAVLAYRSS